MAKRYYLLKYPITQLYVSNDDNNKCKIYIWVNNEYSGEISIPKSLLTSMLLLFADTSYVPVCCFEDNNDIICTIGNKNITEDTILISQDGELIHLKTLLENSKIDNINDSEIIFCIKKKISKNF